MHPSVSLSIVQLVRDGLYILRLRNFDRHRHSLLFLIDNPNKVCSKQMKLEEQVLCCFEQQLIKVVGTDSSLNTEFPLPLMFIYVEIVKVLLNH